MSAPSSAPLFPGGVALSDLRVYDEESGDGCRGGTPHLHSASSEGYVVVGGSGSVQTLSAQGYAEHPLTVGDVLWFSPGTVHRLVNGGDLHLFVIMANAGLPEAGDAVMTFPDYVLADPDAYAAAATVPVGAGRADAVRTRRDLAVEGYLELRAAVERDGPGALARLHARAAALVAPRVADWTRLWERTVAAEMERTREQLQALGRGDAGGLAAASVVRGDPTPGDRGFGMCGRLKTWEWPSMQQDG
ncbi:cupin domain-containing protein [Microbacterium memoriense]|uniref:Cupin domain-containing protein n=1 Tax=Microbacterium memoriense TaxID=2978350 RepID=A0ABT2PDZ0_9MICO|nr:cupin domain-containing protein [Microbacterium memoriense]MCT9002422.1 cupin domain-containing protein [Microbacterium memoriense]